MEVLANPFKKDSMKRYWVRRRGYRRLDSTNRKNMKVVKLGGGVHRRSWRIRIVAKLRLKVIVMTPLRVWRKLKNAYINMMLSFAGNMSSLSEGSVFAGKPISKTPNLPKIFSNTEFNDRLIYEIYKNLIASRELATV